MRYLCVAASLGFCYSAFAMIKKVPRRVAMVTPDGAVSAPCQGPSLRVSGVCSRPANQAHQLERASAGFL